MRTAHLFITILLLMSNTVVSSELIITLPQISTKLTYKHPVRLQQVLTDSTLQLEKSYSHSPYWLGSQLIEPDKNEKVAALKSNIIKQLTFLSRSYPRYKANVEIILSFINQNKFNYRHFISLDNDLVRISPSQNPLLIGDYKLLIALRQNNIQLVGSVGNNIVSYISHGNLNDYLQRETTLQQSDTNTVYLIQPDGKLIQVNNAYWSQSRVYLAPESIIFLGLKNPPHRFNQLNQQIAEFLRYKSPISMEGPTL